MYILRLKHGFSAAHQLKNAYSKECNDFKHGHNWVVVVEIRTPELKNGMVIDFKKLKEIINELDHKDLNEILNFEPTAENIANYLQTKIKKASGLATSVTVWEAENASITYEA